MTIDTLANSPDAAWSVVCDTATASEIVAAHAHSHSAISPRPAIDGRWIFPGDLAYVFLGIESAAVEVVPTVTALASMDVEGLPMSSVPHSITSRQIRIWLVRHGISLAAVESSIESIPDAMTRDIVRVEWEYAPYVERAHAWLAPLAASLGLTEAQVDAAFREAAAI